ncbi:MAG: phosphatidylglycerophosphatase A [Candidatus Neomarinimicrobiota bacterium]|nr:phosphatidylglycerophosphatase A [Candidatus Neomarinimicrobiota bacterium]MEE3241728.1 phosphatidylglycerophosphatase A [Candidatus Neomarinimicrobiota bacterium]
MWLKMDFKNKIVYQIVTLFGLGRLPGGGTWASLFVLFLVIIFEDSSINAISGEIALYTYIMSFFSFGYLYKKSLSFFDSKDPKEFVLDEIAGMSFAIMIVGLFSSFFGGFSFDLPNYINNQELLFVLTFVLFRIFDISKIGPVGWSEDPKNAPLWWKKFDTDPIDSPMRIMADDLVAGSLSSIIVISILSIYLWIL